MSAVTELTGFTLVTWDDSYLTTPADCLDAGCTLFNYVADEHYLMVWL